jgi:hypothetical protein
MPSFSSQDLQGFSTQGTPKNSESDLIVGVVSAHNLYSEPELTCDDKNIFIEFDLKDGSALDKFLELSKDKSLSIDIMSSARPMRLVERHSRHVKLFYPHRYEKLTKRRIYYIKD